MCGSAPRCAEAPRRRVALDRVADRAISRRRRHLALDQVVLRPFSDARAAALLVGEPGEHDDRRSRRPRRGRAGTCVEPSLSGRLRSSRMTLKPRCAAGRAHHAARPHGSARPRRCDSLSISCMSRASAGLSSTSRTLRSTAESVHVDTLSHGVKLHDVQPELLDELTTAMNWSSSTGLVTIALACRLVALQRCPARPGRCVRTTTGMWRSVVVLP